MLAVANIIVVAMSPLGVASVLIIYSGNKIKDVSSI